MEKNYMKMIKVEVSSEYAVGNQMKKWLKDLIAANRMNYNDNWTWKVWGYLIYPVYVSKKNRIFGKNLQRIQNKMKLVLVSSARELREIFSELCVS